MLYVILYLLAIVLANLVISWFGPSMAIVVAFVLIGLDLTTRDKLHDHWHNQHLWRNMALLITSGSVLTIAVNWGAWRIALASMIAFTLAASADTLIYHLLGKRTYLLRVNGSNLVSAAVDSIAFPALAFGFPLLWPIMLGQFIAKVCGGLLWSFLLKRRG